MPNYAEIRGRVEPEVEIRGRVQQTDGSIYVAVISKTKAEWAAIPQYMSVNKVIYVYSDYRQEEDPVTHELVNIPATKIGDGSSYVVDLPFATLAITQADIDRWNNNAGLKVRVDEETNNLVFFN